MMIAINNGGDMVLVFIALKFVNNFWLISNVLYLIKKFLIVIINVENNVNLIVNCLQLIGKFGHVTLVALALLGIFDKSILNIID